jgi:hypothetical protein
MVNKSAAVLVAALVLSTALPVAQTPPASGGPAPAAPGAPAMGRGYSRPDPYDFADHAGWTSMFDGATLKGWNANPAVWSVEDGAITAASTTERMIGTSYIIWDGGEVGDFEWKLEVKLDGDVHSGIAYRSWTDPDRAAKLGPAAPSPPAPPRAGGPARGGAGRGRGAPPQVPSDPRWMLFGPGMDNDADRRNTGHVEDRNTARRFIGWRGSVVRTEAGKLPRVLGRLGDPEILMGAINAGDWNQVHIIARGHQLTHIINGQVMAVAIDDDETFFTPKGLMGWSIEGGAPGRVSVRNLWIKRH